MSQENNSKLPIGRACNPRKTPSAGAGDVRHAPTAGTAPVAEEHALGPPTSKSQRKRDARAIRQLGSELAALGAQDRARLKLPPDIEDAIAELARTTAHGARKRQLGYLSKRLRQLDTGHLERALQRRRLAARAHVELEHRVEYWRERLLGRDRGRLPGDALTDLLSRYPTADSQRLRQLQRQALAEQATGQGPTAARKLYRALRTLLELHSGDNDATGRS